MVISELCGGCDSLEHYVALYVYSDRYGWRGNNCFLLYEPQGHPQSAQQHLEGVLGVL